ncbi:hypothetical protein JOD57_002858 [Geodermatophilus bullaregiensis]|uniref:hypothetical protein n=1 Tax=Geodermatophilus bullaregiensis TaxID=1564160 RepID=UPI00195B8DC2|nr:hypothetical protein [Geodermatophilus bullaregiensis]MBM7807021.1 hypothetical protein [Geodermatophilus bullaregiensis]
MDDLVYVNLGEGRHVDELRFSILSAARHLEEGGDWRIVLFTDRSEPFEDLPVDLVPVTEETASAWMGSHGYVWRAKIKVIEEALARPGTDRCVYVDGDTYFVRSPAEVLRRVGPGRSVLHLREGWPPPPEVAALEHVLSRHRPVDTAGRPWGFGPGRASWNAGVVGLHRDDAHLCGEVQHLTDQLLEHGFGEHSHTSEQLAFTVCLQERTSVRPCHDVVVHYWRSDLREPFEPELRRVWAEPGLAMADRFERLWAKRPREARARRIKGGVKRLAWRLGVKV